MHKKFIKLALASGLILALNPAVALAQYNGTPNGKIYFASSDKTDILSSNADGTNVHAVLSTGDPISVPVVSKDGTKIVYSHAGGTDMGLWVVDVTGSNNHQVTSVSADHNPIWSPDGTKLYFDNGGDIWSVNSDGLDGRTLLLTHHLISDVNVDFYEPSVSPNGLKLAVIGIGARANYGDVYTFSIANNTDLTNVSTNAVKDANTGTATSSLWVDYSPDGAWLAVANYNSNNDGSDHTRIDKLPVAGGAYTNVLTTTVSDSSNWFYSEVNWSPVGDKFVTHKDGILDGDPYYLDGLRDSASQDFLGLRTVSSTNPNPATGFTDLTSLGNVGPAWWTVGTPIVVIPVTPGLPNVGAVK